MINKRVFLLDIPALLVLVIFYPLQHFDNILLPIKHLIFFLRGLFHATNKGKA
jgi:hypothetical protein